MPEPGEIKQCSRRLWKSLQQLDQALVEARLERYMSKPERSAVVARGQDLIELIQKLIEQEGEDEILFSHDGG